MVEILQNAEIKILCKLPAVCSIYIEFCSAQAYVLMILCKLTVWLISILFSLVGYNIWYCVVCDYRGTPPNQPNSHLPEIRMSINDNY